MCLLPSLIGFVVHVIPFGSESVRMMFYKIHLFRRYRRRIGIVMTVGHTNVVCPYFTQITECFYLYVKTLFHSDKTEVQLSEIIEHLETGCLATMAEHLPNTLCAKYIVHWEEKGVRRGDDNKAMTSRCTYYTESFLGASESACVLCTTDQYHTYRTKESKGKGVTHSWAHAFKQNTIRRLRIV